MRMIQKYCNKICRKLKFYLILCNFLTLSLYILNVKCKTIRDDNRSDRIGLILK